jgi:hypothetical protein
MAMLRLVPATGMPVEVAQDSVLIGRDPACEIVLTDGSVSRKHARIERRGEAWFVVDQGSANGTFVEGDRVTETELLDGQDVRFGAVGFRVETDGAYAGATVMTGLDQATSVQPGPTTATPVSAGTCDWPACRACGASACCATSETRAMAVDWRRLLRLPHRRAAGRCRDYRIFLEEIGGRFGRR